MAVRKRTSHVLEFLKRQAEERKAAEEEAAANGDGGGDQPFPDFGSELGLGKSSAEGQQSEGEGQQ